MTKRVRVKAVVLQVQFEEVDEEGTPIGFPSQAVQMPIEGPDWELNWASEHSEEMFQGFVSQLKGTERKS